MSIRPLRRRSLGRAFVRSVEVDDVPQLIAAIPDPAAVAWVTGPPDNSTGLVGWGEARRFEVDGAERFSRAAQWWSSLHLDEPAYSFASFAFDSRSTQRSVVVVPAVTLRRQGDRTWLYAVADDEVEAQANLDRARAALTTPHSAPEPPAAISYGQGALPVLRWEKAVAEAVCRIENGQLDKVVLARDVVASAAAPIDARSLLHRLATTYPTCATFLVDGLVGATPELLVTKRGDAVSSRVLAGTVRRSRDVTRDANLATSLLGSAKDHAEHRYAVDSVAAALAAHCTNLVVPAHPRLLALPNVQHLATDVTGVLADSSSVLALAASLHPTAAVCGTPRERALDLIRELEGLDRGRYSGPVGWMDTVGDGEFGIALRCGQIEGRTARLFAGCGLVAGSQPESELAESQAKLVAMRDALESN